MPELPEIEILARDLRRAVVGKTIVDVHVGQHKAINMPLEEFRQQVHGTVAGVDRHGKSAILCLPGGSLWLHMGLGGTTALLHGAPWPAAKFLGLRFADDCQLAVEKAFMGHAHFFGVAERARGEELGCDALDQALDLSRFSALLRHKPKVAVKAALMDQAVIAGIGNTYSDEIVHRARIHPARRVATLRDEEIAVLHRALRAALEEAISYGGEPSWLDFAGQHGRYRFAVHQANHCGSCGGVVQSISAGGRTGYFCPECQPEGG